MSSHSHVSHCRVRPLGEFTVTIPEPHATLQGAVTWRNQCDDRATLQGVRILSGILKIVFRHILFFVLFLMQFRLWWARLSYRLRYTCSIHFLNFWSRHQPPFWPPCSVSVPLIYWPVNQKYFGWPYFQTQKPLELQRQAVNRNSRTCETTQPSRAVYCHCPLVVSQRH